MNKLLQQLSDEIYIAYLNFIMKGILIKACEIVKNSPDILAFKSSEPILIIKKKEKSYINHEIVVEIQKKIYHSISTDLVFISDEELKTHFLNCYLFIYACLHDASFLSTFERNFHSIN